MSQQQSSTVEKAPQGAPEPVVYVVETSRGFTESFDARTIQTLVNLGLIEHVRDGHVLADGKGNPVGALHRFYTDAKQWRS